MELIFDFDQRQGIANTNLKLKALILDRQLKRQNPILPTGSMFSLL